MLIDIDPHGKYSEREKEYDEIIHQTFHLLPRFNICCKSGKKAFLSVMTTVLVHIFPVHSGEKK